jgi:hypothetical protein
MKSNNDAKVQRDPNDASNRSARNFVYENSRATGRALHVLMALSDYADDKRQCFPTVPTLAAHAGVSESTVKRGTKELVEVGDITVEERYDANGVPTSNLYTLTILPTNYKKNATKPLPESEPKLDLPTLDRNEWQNARQLASDYGDDRLLQMLNAYGFFIDEDTHRSSILEIRERIKVLREKQIEKNIKWKQEFEAKQRAKGHLDG